MTAKGKSLALMLTTLVIAGCANDQVATPDGGTPTQGIDPPDATEAAFPEGDVAIELWTIEADPQAEFVSALTDEFSAIHPNITFDVVSKDPELMLQEMVGTSTAPQGQPELLWTAADRIGLLTAAGVIQPVDELVDTTEYVEAALVGVQAEGRTWAVPISVGQHLMLYWNKTMIGDEAPADTDEMIGAASASTVAPDSYGLVFDETDALWLAPWIGGFGGSVFADDGVTPTLDTDAVRFALEFLYRLKFTEQLMPASCDGLCASDLFTTGAAAMIVDGDWQLARYGDQLGEDLGVGPLPRVTATGRDPQPYTVATVLMVPSAVQSGALTVVKEFMGWVTAPEQQLRQLQALARLPANAEAAADPAIQDDALLAGSFAAVEKGIPRPTGVEARCVLDQMDSAIQGVLANGISDIAAVTAALQANAEACIGPPA